MSKLKNPMKRNPRVTEKMNPTRGLSAELSGAHRKEMRLRITALRRSPAKMLMTRRAQLTPGCSLDFICLLGCLDALVIEASRSGCSFRVCINLRLQRGAGTLVPARASTCDLSSGFSCKVVRSFCMRNGPGPPRSRRNRRMGTPRQTKSIASKSIQANPVCGGPSIELKMMSASVIASLHSADTRSMCVRRQVSASLDPNPRGPPHL
mmetsp:Transcript_63277/g.87011  ORF Transcript_63277/g.87011 Transcript_63277/m.87011 type:complete len:208 (-) Transcript_63277:144-767(-)